MSWTISSLKDVAKERLQYNYWKTVFVTIMVTLLSFGSVFSAIADSVQQMPGVVRDIYANMTRANHAANMQLIALMVTLTVGIILVDIFVKVALGVFIKNPVDVGARLFLKKNLNDDDRGTIADITYAFDHDYLYHVKIMFVVKMIAFLWYFVFIIPGIIKQYEYRVVPYLLSERSDLTAAEAMRISSEMMRGSKMKAFLLDLSFVPWHIVGLISFGILEVFYVGPYKALADTVLYSELKKEYLKEKEEKMQ